MEVILAFLLGCCAMGSLFGVLWVFYRVSQVQNPTPVIELDLRRDDIPHTVIVRLPEAPGHVAMSLTFNNVTLPEFKLQGLNSIGLGFGKIGPRPDRPRLSDLLCGHTRFSGTLCFEAQYPHPIQPLAWQAPSL